jgi:glutathione S-transferase
MPLTVHGYHHSVYVRIVRMTLIEKRLAWEHVEVDPFASEPDPHYARLNPFGRVPTVVDDGFVIYETAAITRYLDETHAETRLQPADPRQRARMTQIISVIDSYGYWPMVRQVFARAVFGPATGEARNEAAIAEGLARSARVLEALDGLAGEGPCLVGDSLSLADLHLAPMMAYFLAAPEARPLLAPCRKLARWWEAMATRPSLARTDPGLPVP